MAMKQLRTMAYFSMLIVLLPLLLVNAFADHPAEAPQLVLSVQELELGTGRSVRITYTLPEGLGQPQKTEWKTEDPKIAGVSGGTVWAVAPGSTTLTLTITFPDGQVMTAQCPVEAYRPVSSVTVPMNLTVGVGKSTEPVDVSVKPADAKYQAVSFVSDEEAIAAVDENGVITGVSAGITTITVTSREPVVGQAAPKSARIRVQVVQMAQSITLNETSTDVAKGRALKLTAAVGPENTTNPRVVWASSDPKILFVSSDGTVQGVGIGKATVTAATTDGSNLTAVCEIEVYPSVTGLKAEAASIVVDVGVPKPLQITVSPADAKYQGMTFVSSDPSIVTVDSQGVVTGVRPGTARITITSTEPVSGQYIAKATTVNVTVIQMVREITLNQSNAELLKGTSMTLTAAISPQAATNSRLTWQSSDPSVASVSNGTVTGMKAGTVTITAAATDGSNLSAACSITVIQPITGITDRTTWVAVSEEMTLQLTPNVAPENATDKTLKWFSDDTRIATVNSSGCVTGRRAGKCKITAAAADGSGKEIVYNLTVEPKIPLEIVAFSRSGDNGFYNKFAITFKNQTNTHTIDYISFQVIANSGASNEIRFDGYVNSHVLASGNTCQIGWWKMAGLTYSDSFVIKLKSVGYTDGTLDYFPDQPIIGTFPG